MLLSYGADPNILVYGEAGTNAALRPPLAELLIRYDTATVFSIGFTMNTCFSNDNVQLEEVKLLLKHGARVIFKTQFRTPEGLLNC